VVALQNQVHLEDLVVDQRSYYYQEVGHQALEVEHQVQEVQSKSYYQDVEVLQNQVDPFHMDLKAVLKERVHYCYTYPHLDLEADPYSFPLELHSYEEEEDHHTHHQSHHLVAYHRPS